MRRLLPLIQILILFSLTLTNISLGSTDPIGYIVERNGVASLVRKGGEELSVSEKNVPEIKLLDTAVTGNGTTITVLNLTITPKFANSMLVMSWMINGEVGENNMFLIHRDGVLITDTGYESYNTISGNVRYSGFTPSYYDANNSSTPRSSCIQYAIPAYTTNARTYAPAVRGSGATALTYYLNRTVASTGADNQEQTISTGILMEISQ